MKHLIIGGVAGGATAAARIRRADEHCEIIMFEKGKNISYANCGLPYYIGGVIDERDKLFLQTPQSFGQRFTVDVRVNSEVIKIDPSRKEVTVRTSKNEVYIESYDKLLMSPGASPVRPPLNGIDSEGIFTLRNVADTDNIKKFINTHKINSAVVIGAGFIGLEMAENLHHLGAQVSIVEMAPQVMTPIDFPMAAMVHQHLNQKEVNLYLGEQVSSFRKRGEAIDVIFKSGKELVADIVILSIGVRPETTLAKDAGLKIGEAGGIWVNEFMQTSETDIYAVGDAVEFPHPVTGQSWLNYLAVPANRQGRIVADNMVFGNKLVYEGAIGTSIAKVFDLTVAAAGMNETRLKSQNVAFITSTTHSGSNAGYYPGAMPMSIKINFAPVTGQLLGAQIVGYVGVDKRIDQIALLIKHNKTIYDLIQIEHAYAPPFASAKDPIAIAGYVAHNIISGKMPVVYWTDVVAANSDEVYFLDVRTDDEFSLGSIDGAVNIPLDDLRGRLDEIPTDKTIFVFCAIGLRGYLASNILLQRGLERVFNISGGYKTYQAAVSKIENVNHLQVLDKRKNELDLDIQSPKPIKKLLTVDACGLQCPGPILKMKKSMDDVEPGDRVEMVATDAGFSRDAQAWCNMTGNRLITKSSEAGKYTVVIEKKGVTELNAPDVMSVTALPKGKTLIVFSDDLDKALASLVIANGAAATGEKVTIFFTFWGLNVIKKVKKPSVPKDIFGKMFGLMLPSSSKQLALSKMNMMGMGSKMMRHIMKIRGIDSLESLRQQAIDNGVEFIACQMSMDVMGVAREELLDEVTIGGVASYMERAEQSNVNLFI
jgi:NADPH-dependent 2,4-dienoyl-CoA reductase/sulfur reductase-like enzyme/peroxiredoxin family protein/rhodanese-related sulfurtransferase/TusA-related sulfurtransferase